MKPFNEYRILEELPLATRLPSGVEGYLAEDDLGNDLELFTIGATEQFSEVSVKRYIETHIRSLRAINIRGLQKILACGFDDAQKKGFVVYEHMENVEEMKLSKTTLSRCLDILGQLQRNNLRGSINKDTVIFHAGKAKLRYMGIFTFPPGKKDVTEDMISLSNMLIEYLTGTNEGREIYENIKSGIYRKYADIKTAVDKILSDGSNENNLPIVKIMVKNSDHEKIELLLQEVNNSECYYTLHKKNSTNGDIEGVFSTSQHSGRISISRNWGGIFTHIFISRWYRVPNENVMTSGEEFPFHFSLYEESSDEAVEYFGIDNSLSRNYNDRDSVIKIWESLPNKEKEYIQEKSLKFHYSKAVRSNTNPHNYKFVLTDDIPDWNTISEKKKTDVYFSIGDSKIGKIVDYKAESKTLILKDVANIEKISDEGILEEDISQETIPLSRQVTACEQFRTSNIVNPVLAGILATPMTFAPKGIPGISPNDLNPENKTLNNDEIQKIAVTDAMHKKPIYLIQGPPGTGKTTVILELIQQIIKRDSTAKILVVSQTNPAVDNVLERLLDTKISFVRLASTQAVTEHKINTTIKEHTHDEKMKYWAAGIKRKTSSRADDVEKLRTHFGAIQKNVNNHEESSHQLALDSLHKNWISYVTNATSTKRGKTVSKINNGSAEINLQTAYVLTANVIGSTCIHIAAAKYRDYHFDFDYMIMDEASKATAAEALVPINMSRNIILIGDHHQLPPFITKEKEVRMRVKEELEDEGMDIDKTYGESLFEYLIKAFEGVDALAGYKIMLNVQYRMSRSIGHLISKSFYNAALKNPINMDAYDSEKSHGLNLAVPEINVDGEKIPNAILFVTTSAAADRYDNGNSVNRANNHNANIIKGIVETLKKRIDDSFGVGVIAGYNGQVRLLRSVISDLKPDNINTVDKFQGQERDVIIYDIVRSGRGQESIGFLNDYRRLNVAFSRARRLLIIVGDSEFILKKATFDRTDQFPDFKLREIVNLFNKWGVIFNSFEDAFNA